MYIRAIVVWILILACVTKVVGDQLDSLKYNFGYIHFDNGDHINCRENIIQDTTGLLWIATPDQLLCYDGAQLLAIPLVLTDDDKPFQDIQLFEKLSDDQYLLVSSDNQFIIFDPYLRAIVDHKTLPSIYQDEVGKTLSKDQTGSMFTEDKIVADGTGGFWVFLRAEPSDLYYLFRSDTSDELKFLRSINIKGISTISIYHDRLFVSKSGGVYILDKDGNAIDTLTLSLSSDAITPMLATNGEDQLWAYEFCQKGACAIHMYEEDSNVFMPYAIPDDVDLSAIHKLELTHATLWFLGVNKLIAHELGTDNFTEYFKPIATSFSAIDPIPLISHFTSISEATDGIIWAGSEYGLVQMTLDNSAYDLIMKSDPEYCTGFCSMRGIDIDDEGNLWMAYYSSVVKRSSNGEYEKIEALDPYLSNGIYSLHHHGERVIVNDIIYHTRTGKIEDLIENHENGHITNSPGPDDDIYFSTCFENGNHVNFYRYDFTANKLQQIALPEDLRSSGQFTDMLLNYDKNTLYITTTFKGSYAYDIKQGSFRSIVPKKYWDEEYIRHFTISETQDGDLYIGTSYALLELDLTTAEIKEHQYGIQATDKKEAVRQYFSMADDGQGSLWLGTSHGLLSFNTSDKQFESYYGQGAIGRQEFNRESAYVNKEGIAHFGSVNGVFIFDPITLQGQQNNKQTNQLNLISVTHLDSKIEKLITDHGLPIDNDRLELEYNDRMVSFTYSLPEYRTDQSIYYSYYLEGFDVAWSTPGLTNTIRFTNLDPGDYTLRVKTGLDQNSMVLDPLEIPIHISNAWYRTWWFRILIASIVIASIYWYYRSRYLEVLKYEKLRSDISRDLHDDVGSILAGIAMRSELLEDSIDDDLRPLAEGIANDSRGVLTTMRDTVWAIDSRKDTSKDLNDRILDFVEDVLPNKDIRYDYQSNLNDKALKLKPTVRQNIYLIAKESINNILKHSDTDEVKINLHMDKNNISLRIKDQGSQQTRIKTSGQGISNMEQRAMESGGTFSFSYDQGYTVDVSLPL